MSDRVLRQRTVGLQNLDKALRNIQSIKRGDEVTVDAQERMWFALLDLNSDEFISWMSKQERQVVRFIGDTFCQMGWVLSLYCSSNNRSGDIMLDYKIDNLFQRLSACRFIEKQKRV